MAEQVYASQPDHEEVCESLISYNLGALSIAGACRKALEVRPRQARFHAVLVEQGKWADLELCFAQARKACPDNLLPYLYAAMELAEEGKELHRAEGWLRSYLGQEAEGMAPDHAGAHGALAQVYEKQGRRAEATRELGLALDLRPTYKWARQELAPAQEGVRRLRI